MRTEFRTVESEGALIRGIMDADVDPKSLGLSGSHFASPVYGAIFDAMLSTGSTDVTVLEDHLGQNGQLKQIWTLSEDSERVFGGEALHCLSDEEAPSNETVHIYVDTIKDRASRRQLSLAIHKADGVLAEDGLSPALSMLSEAITSVRAASVKDIHKSADTLEEAITSLREDADHYIAWPHKELNRIAPGYGPGKLLVIASYPNHGKTVLLSQFADKACRQGLKVLFVPLEMTRKEMILRMFQQCGFSAEEYVRAGVVHAPMAKRVEELTQDFDLHFHECFDMDSILSAAEAVKPDVLIVDHLHRLPWAHMTDLMGYCREFKNLSMRNNCAVILGSQLIKPQAEREKGVPRPSVNYLKGAGAIEEEADAIIFLYRPTTDGHKGKHAEVMVYKTRFGVGDFTYGCVFDERTLTFRPGSLAPHESN